MGKIVYQGSLYREWLHHHKNLDSQTCDVQIESLEKLWTNYLKVLGENINVSNLRSISIPYRDNLNPYFWICDCINREDYKLCKHIMNLYLSLLNRLHFEISYNVEEFDHRESYGFMRGYRPEIGYNESFNDDLTQFQKLIIYDINSVFPNVIMELNTKRKLPNELECAVWISSWKLYSKFISSLISSFCNSDYRYYNGSSINIDRLKTQDYCESIMFEDEP